RDLVAVVRAVAARDEHDRGAAAVRTGKRTSDLEPCRVGKLNVEEDDLGVEQLDLLERLAPVLGLADDLEPLGFEKRPRGGAEARVVVHAENGAGDCRNRRRGCSAAKYGYPYSVSQEGRNVEVARIGRRRRPDRRGPGTRHLVGQPRAAAALRAEAGRDHG